MGTGYVNAMLESLQSNYNRVDCSELCCLVITVSLSIFATSLITFVLLIYVLFSLY